MNSWPSRGVRGDRFLSDLCSFRVGVGVGVGVGVCVGIGVGEDASYVAVTLNIEL